MTLVQGWYRDGLNDDQVAHNIGITRKTLYEWQARFSEFRDAIKKGKAPVDYEVENALYKRATGYKVTLKKPIKVCVKKKITGKGETSEEHIEYADVEEYIPPDTTAQIFWLKNRKPKQWRDKVEPAPEGQTNELLQSLLDLERGKQ